MRSKVVAAEMARSGGVAVVIADGRTPGVVAEAAAGRPVGTRFSAEPSPLSAYKLWVRYGKPRARAGGGGRGRHAGGVERRAPACWPSG